MPATVSQGTTPEGPKVELQSSQHRSGGREHGKTPEKHLQRFLVKALSMAVRSNDRGLGVKTQVLNSSSAPGKKLPEETSFSPT